LRTATQTFRKGLIQKLRIEWAKKRIFFLSKGSFFCKKKESLRTATQTFKKV